MEGFTLSRDGIPLRFEVAGSGMPTLVFVHGWSCDRSYWKAQLDHFAKQHEVVAIDLAGHGGSGLGRVEWTMPAFGEDVVAVADHLDLRRMILIGHSMGGDVITEAALRMGERVKGVVWVDTYKRLGKPRTLEEVEALVEPLRSDREEETRKLVRRMFLATSDEELVRWVADDMAAAPAEVSLNAFVHAITFEPDLIVTLSHVRAPLVAINPDYLPTDIEALRSHGVEAVVMPSVGHFLMMEDPPRFNRVLEEVIARF